MLTIARTAMRQDGDGLWQITCGAVGLTPDDKVPHTVTVVEDGGLEVEYTYEGRTRVNPMFNGWTYRAPRPASRRERWQYFVLVHDFAMEDA